MWPLPPQKTNKGIPYRIADLPEWVNPDVVETHQSILDKDGILAANQYAESLNNPEELTPELLGIRADYYRKPLTESVVTAKAPPLNTPAGQKSVETIARNVYEGRDDQNIPRDYAHVVEGRTKVAYPMMEGRERVSKQILPWLYGAGVAPHIIGAAPAIGPAIKHGLGVMMNPATAKTTAGALAGTLFDAGGLAYGITHTPEAINKLFTTNYDSGWQIANDVADVALSTATIPATAGVFARTAPYLQRFTQNVGIARKALQNYQQPIARYLKTVDKTPTIQVKNTITQSKHPLNDKYFAIAREPVYSRTIPDSYLEGVNPKLINTSKAPVDNILQAQVKQWKNANSSDIEFYIDFHNKVKKGIIPHGYSKAEYKPPYANVFVDVSVPDAVPQSLLKYSERLKLRPHDPNWHAINVARDVMDKDPILQSVVKAYDSPLEDLKLIVQRNTNLHDVYPPWNKLIEFKPEMRGQYLGGGAETDVFTFRNNPRYVLKIFDTDYTPANLGRTKHKYENVSELAKGVADLTLHKNYFNIYAPLKLRGYYKTSEGALAPVFLQRRMIPIKATPTQSIKLAPPAMDYLGTILNPNQPIYKYISSINDVRVSNMGIDPRSGKYWIIDGLSQGGTIRKKKWQPN